MENNERKNRVAEALAIRGLDQVDLVEKTGIKKASVNSWIKQRWQPKQESLLKMARALEVSEMWLAGYDVPMERPVEQVKMDTLGQVVNIIRKDERLTNLVINLSTLSEAQLSTVESMINELVKVNRQH